MTIGIIILLSRVKVYPTVAAYSKTILSYGSESGIFSDKTEFPYYSRTAPNTKMTSQATMALLAALRWHNIALLYRDDAWGQNTLLEMQSVSQSAVSIITTQPLKVDGSDSAGNLTASITISTGTPVVVLIQFGTNMKNSVVDIRAKPEGANMGIIAMATVSRSWLDEESFQLSAVGLLVVEPYVPASFDEWRSNNLTGVATNVYSAQAWDSVYAMAKALDSMLSSGLDPTSCSQDLFVAHLRNITYSGPLGMLRFDAAGDRYQVNSYQSIHANGSVVEIGRYDSATGVADVNSSLAVMYNGDELMSGIARIIRVGALLSTTSPLYASKYTAMQLAASMANNISSILAGKTIQIALYTYSTTNELISRTTSMLQDPLIVAVVGPQTSADTEVVGPFIAANANSVPQLSFSATATDLSDSAHYPNLVRVCADDATTASAVAALISGYGYGFYSVVREDSTYGLNGFNALNTALSARSPEGIGSVAVSRGATAAAIETALVAVVSYGARALVFWLDESEMSLITNCTAMSTASARGAAFLLPWRPTSSEIVLVRGMIAMNEQFLNPAYSDVETALTAASGTMSAYAGLAYDSVVLLANAIHSALESSGDFDPSQGDKTRQALQNYSAATLPAATTGVMSFRPGKVDRANVILQISNAQLSTNRRTGDSSVGWVVVGTWTTTSFSLPDANQMDWGAVNLTDQTTGQELVCGQGHFAGTKGCEACLVDHYCDASTLHACPAYASTFLVTGQWSASQCVCKFGYYWTGTSCSKCPTGGWCYHGQAYPKSRYWKSQSSNATISLCPAEALASAGAVACQGADRCVVEVDQYVNQTCLDELGGSQGSPHYCVYGASGPLCLHCEPLDEGFVMNAQHQCTECPPEGIVVLYFLIGFPIAVLVCRQIAVSAIGIGAEFIFEERDKEEKEKLERNEFARMESELREKEKRKAVETAVHLVAEPLFGGTSNAGLSTRLKRAMLRQEVVQALEQSSPRQLEKEELGMAGGGGDPGSDIASTSERGEGVGELFRRGSAEGALEIEPARGGTESSMKVEEIHELPSKAWETNSGNGSGQGAGQGAIGDSPPRLLPPLLGAPGTEAGIDRGPAEASIPQPSVVPAPGSSVRVSPEAPFGEQVEALLEEVRRFQDDEADGEGDDCSGQIKTLDDCDRATLASKPFLVFKVVWAGLQVNQIACTLELQWPAVLKTLFSAQSYATGFSFTFVECIVSKLDFSVPAPFVQAFCMGMLPVVIYISAYFYLWIDAYKKNSTMNATVPKDAEEEELLNQMNQELEDICESLRGFEHKPATEENERDFKAAKESFQACLDHQRGQRQRINRTGITRRDKLTTTCWAMFYFLHTNICCQLLHALNCTSVDGKKILLKDSNVECWQGDAVLWQFLAVVSLTMYMIAPFVPVVPLFHPLEKQWDNLSNLAKVKAEVEGYDIWDLLHSVVGHINFRRVRRYAFLYGSYSGETLWWEVAVLLRRFLAIGAVVWGHGSGINMQLLLSMLVLVIATVMNHRMQPYAHTAFQSLEDVSLFSSLVTIWGGWALTISSQEMFFWGGHEAITMTIVLVNVGFILYGFYILIFVVSPIYANHERIAKHGGFVNYVFRLLYGSEYSPLHGIRGYVSHNRGHVTVCHHQMIPKPRGAQQDRAKGKVDIDGIECDVRTLSDRELTGYLEAMSYRGNGGEEQELRDRIESGEVQVMRTLDATVSFPVNPDKASEVSQYVAVTSEDVHGNCQACPGHRKIVVCKVLPDDRHVNSFHKSL